VLKEPGAVDIDIAMAGNLDGRPSIRIILHNVPGPLESLGDSLGPTTETYQSPPCHEVQLEIFRDADHLGADMTEVGGRPAPHLTSEEVLSDPFDLFGRPVG